MLLLQSAAEGRLAATLAQEGGMPSVLWAGPRKKGPVRLKLGVVVEKLRYEIECGLPILDGAPVPTKFHMDPLVKVENIWFQDAKTPVHLMERRGGACWARDDQGRRAEFHLTFWDSESALSQLLEPHRFPQVAALRQEMQRWRFYHHFRTDEDSPIRHPQIGTRTPILSHDGRDLAAALQTIIENGEDRSLEESIEQAFPGGRLGTSTEEGRFIVSLELPGLLRPMDARELSDGTLRYLCLLAALLTPRPPQVLALNEPETSLHPDLMAPLAKLIVRASGKSQIWLTTHSQRLAQCIEEESGVKSIPLEKVGGETRIAGKGKYVFDND
jgi:predicted ATPase